jgi:hypothetical protein
LIAPIITCVEDATSGTYNITFGPVLRKVAQYADVNNVATFCKFRSFAVKAGKIIQVLAEAGFFLPNCDLTSLFERPEIADATREPNMIPILVPT